MKPRLCFVGTMAGIHGNHIPTTGLTLSQLFAAVGYPVHAVSTSPHRLGRLADTLVTLTRRRHATDLVLLDVYGGLSFVVEDLVSRLCKRFRLPLIMTLHGGHFPAFIRAHPNGYRRGLQRACQLVAPSPFLAQIITDAYGFDVQVIPNVIELNNYAYRRRDQVGPNLFWMRSFHDIYHPELAIEALAGLRSLYPEARLIMGGKDKGLLEPVVKLAKTRGVADAVEFVGFLDMTGKQVQMARSDIYLNTNRVDNMPVSVLEAAASGLPIVATHVGGIPFLLTNEDTALLVPCEHPEAMTQALIRLIQSPKLARDLSERGRQLAERSAWDVVRPQWEALFAQVLRDKEPTTFSRMTGYDMRGSI